MSDNNVNRLDDDLDNDPNSELSTVAKKYYKSIAIKIVAFLAGSFVALDLLAAAEGARIGLGNIDPLREHLMKDLGVGAGFKHGHLYGGLVITAIILVAGYYLKCAWDQYQASTKLVEFDDETADEAYQSKGSGNVVANVSS